MNSVLFCWFSDLELMIKRDRRGHSYSADQICHSNHYLNLLLSTSSIFKFSDLISSFKKRETTSDILESETVSTVPLGASFYRNYDPPLRVFVPQIMMICFHLSFLKRVQGARTRLKSLLFP